MLGAIAGDIIGSVHEFNCQKSMEFPLFVAHSNFTDDSVLTVAVAECLLTGAGYADKFREYTLAYPGRGYGGMFYQWATCGNRMPYNSWGNGSAMRVSPVAFAFEDLDAVVLEAGRTAVVTHNHPEGIRGAKATAAATFLARKKASKAEIRKAIESRFEYDLGRPIAEIRETYAFDESCQGTVPEAIAAFLESENYENSIRLAISLGGDADTLACITGGMAAAFYGGVPKHIAEPVWALLDDRMRTIVTTFCTNYGVPHIPGQS